MTAVRKKPRARKCKVCFCSYTPRDSMQQTCYDFTCAIQYGKKLTAKRLRLEKREGRERLKTLSQLCADAQKDVNRYIRLRDRYKGCISCENGKVTDAGHRFHAGTKYRTSRLRFDHRCLNGQCQDCNRYNGGRPAEYDEGFRVRYGEVALNDLHAMKAKADRGELAPLTREEVGQIAAAHRLLCRELMANANKTMLA